MVNLAVALRVTEQASRPLRRTADAANAMAEKANKMSTQLRAANVALVGLAVASSAAIGLMASQASIFEQSMSRLQTVTAASTKSVQGSLEDSAKAAKEFSTEFTASANEIVRAQFQIATSGVGVTDQIAATQAAFKLARATMGEFTQSAQVLGSFLNTFGKTAEFNYLAPVRKMEALTDRLAVAVQRFQVTLPVLAESFKFIVGPASQLNLKLSEVSSAIGVLNTAGFRGTLAGTALSNMFNKLNRATEKLNLNPDKFIDLNGNLKSLTSFLDEVNRSLENKTPIEAQNALIDTFDIRAGRVAKTLLNSTEAIKRFAAEMDVSRGATKRMSDLVESTSTGSFKKMQNAFGNLAITMGDTFLSALVPVMNGLRGFAIFMNEVVDATGAWIPAAIAASAIALTFAVTVGGATAAVAGLTSALKILAVASRTASAALVAVRVALIATGIGAIVAVVVALGTAFFFAWGAIKNWLTGAELASDISGKIERGFNNGATAAANFADEIGILNAAVEGGVKVAPKGASFGETGLAQEVEKLVASNMDFDAAVKQAFETTNGFQGALFDLASQSKSSFLALDNLAKSFVEIRSATDRTFAPMSQLAKLTEFAKERIEAFSLAAISMGGNTQQGGEAIAELARNVGDLSKAFSSGVTGAGDKFLRKIFENFSGNLDNLRSSTDKQVTKIVALFDERKFANNPIIDSGDDEFRALTRNLLGINNRIDQSTNRAQKFLQVVNGAETAMKQTARATKTVSNIIKNAKQGGESFANAMKLSGTESDKAVNSLKSLVDLQPKIGQFLKDAKAEFGGTAAFGQLSKIFETFDQTQLQLRIGINESEILRQGISVSKQLEEEFGRFNSRQLKEIGSFAKKISNSIGDALTNSLSDGKSLFSNLANDFKTSFVDRIKEQIGTRISGAFAPQLEEAIRLATSQLSGFNAQQLINIDSNDVASKINSALNAAIPGLTKITGGDIFKVDAVNELAKSFKDISVGSQVALVTAGNRSAAIIRQLQTVLSTGPSDTLMGLNEQATRLTSLIKEADRTGGSGAVKFAEQALQGVLERMQQLQSASSPNSLANQAQRGATAIENSAIVMERAIATLVPAAREFAGILSNSFDKIQVAAVTDSNSLDINITTGDSKIEVSIDSAASGIDTSDGLDEDEVRKIVDEVKAQMDEERDEIIRKLEDELRGR